MGKIQKRRSISVKGSTYAALQVHCAGLKRSMSDLVEGLLHPLLEQSVYVRAAPLVPIRVEVDRSAPRATVPKPITTVDQPIPLKVTRKPPPAHRPIPNGDHRNTPIDLRHSVAKLRRVPLRDGADVRQEGRPAPTPARVPARVGGPRLW